MPNTHLPVSELTDSSRYLSETSNASNTSNIISAESLSVNTVCSYITLNSPWMWYMSMIAGSSIATFSLQYFNPLPQGSPYAVARGSGAAMKYTLFPLLVLPVMRVFTTILQNSNIGRYLSLNRKISSHQFIAVGLIITAITHTIAHIINNQSILLTYEGFTGIIMISAFAFPIVLPVFYKDSNYTKAIAYDLKFLLPHQLGALIFFSAYAMHTKDLRLIPWTIAVVGSFLIDKLIETVFYTHSSVVCGVRMLGEDMVEFEIERPPHLKSHTAGQYLFLHITSLQGMFRVGNPLTISSGPNEAIIRFIVNINGPRTRHLIDICKERRLDNSARVTLTGPFGSPLQSQVKKSKVFLISTGTGMTAFIPLLLQKAGSHAPIEMLTIHSGRDPRQFVPFLEAIYQAAINGVDIREAHFYLTLEEPKELILNFLIDLQRYNKINWNMKFVDMGGLFNYESQELGEAKSIDNVSASLSIAPSISCSIENLRVIARKSTNFPDKSLAFNTSVFFHRGRFDPEAHEPFIPANSLIHNSGISNTQTMSQHRDWSFFYCGNNSAGEKIKQVCRKNGAYFAQEAFSL